MFKLPVYILDRNVLVVATPTFGKFWRAYLGVVAGKDHEAEYMEVTRTGAAVRESLARFLFPEKKDEPYDN